MIVFLATRRNTFTLDAVVAAVPPGRVVVMPYEEALSRRFLPRATYVFTDLDRLPARALERAANWHRRLRLSGARALNDPAAFVQRYDLLLRLRAAGINPFGAWRAASADLVDRWPVFLRTDHGHQAPQGDLIDGPAALRRAVSAAVAAGADLGNLIVVEYCAEPLPGGLFRKLSVYRMGRHWFADSCVHARHWVAKIGQDGIASPELYADELRIMRDNPYRQAVAAIFDLAGVEYGRVDFGLVGGEPRIYEINTNPHVQFLGPSPSPFRSETRSLFRQRYLAALEAVDAGA